MRSVSINKGSLALKLEAFRSEPDVRAQECRLQGNQSLLKPDDAPPRRNRYDRRGLFSLQRLRVVYEDVGPARLRAVAVESKVDGVFHVVGVVGGRSTLVADIVVKDLRKQRTVGGPSIDRVNRISSRRRSTRDRTLLNVRLLTKSRGLAKAEVVLPGAGAGAKRRRVGVRDHAAKFNSVRPLSILKRDKADTVFQVGRSAALDKETDDNRLLLDDLRTRGLHEREERHGGYETVGNAVRQWGIVGNNR